MKKDLLFVVIILFASILVSLPLTKPGLHVAHDDQQVVRLYLFDKALREGQFPVRWVDELGFGFGYPLFVFYPPLVYMIGELFHLGGFGFITSIKLVFFFSILASGISMYILVRELYSRIPALISAVFYILAPYRAIDIYIRGALAESTSFVWLPLILWSFYKLFQTGKWIHIYLSAIFLALLMITHNLIFLPFMIILAIYLLFLIWQSPDKKLFMVYCLWSIVISLGLSAFFWIPAIIEKKFTIVDQLLLVNLANYNIHFVYPQQLWNWPWGFGGSAEGLTDGISFKIGKLHILVSIVAVVLAISHLLKNRDRSKLILHNSYFIILIFVLFLFSAFMTTFYSKPIWGLIPALRYLQFPWRFLTFTTLFSSILAGAMIYFFRIPILKMMLPVPLLLLIFAFNLKLFKPQFYRIDLTDKGATESVLINWEVSRSSFEYLPSGVELYKSDLGTNLPNIKKEEIPHNRLEIVSGTAQIKNLKSSPSKVEFELDSKDRAVVQANIFNFPGWLVKVNNKSVQIDNNNKLKLITFSVDKGTPQIKIEFKNTFVRFLANTVSLFSIILLVLSNIVLLKKIKLKGVVS